MNEADHKGSALRITLMRLEDSPFRWTIDVARVACPPPPYQSTGQALRNHEGSALHIKCISIFNVLCFYLFFKYFLEGGKKDEDEKRWLLTALVIPVGYAGVAITGSLEPTSVPWFNHEDAGRTSARMEQKITDASKRFELVLDSAVVLDKETGLVWEKSPGYNKENLAYC